jgi:aminomethyltransferase
LYGHELDENTTPLEAGLKTFVSFEKGDFNGRSALVEQRDYGIEKRCVAFKMSGRGAPPRPGYAIWSSGSAPSQIGRVVSGSLSPSLDVGIGMGYVPPGFAKKGTEIEIAIRDKRYPAVIVPKPFLRK